MPSRTGIPAAGWLLSKLHFTEEAEGIWWGERRGGWKQNSLTLERLPKGPPVEGGYFWRGATGSAFSDTLSWGQTPVMATGPTCNLGSDQRRGWLQLRAILQGSLSNERTGSQHVTVRVLLFRNPTVALSFCSSLGKTEAPDLCDRPGGRRSVSELYNGRLHGSWMKQTKGIIPTQPLCLWAAQPGAKGPSCLATSLGN